MSRLFLAVVVLVASVASGRAQAKDLVLLCSTGLQSAIGALSGPYEALSGDRLVITFDTSNLLKAKLDAGAPFDVAVLTPGLIADLVKQGRVLEGSARVIARAGVGIAVLHGAARPDISTVEAFKAALLATPSIVYTTSGQSGQAFMAAVAKMGLTEVVQAKGRPIVGGATGDVVVRGDAAMAAQLVPELMAVPGVDVVGPLPEAVQSYVVLSGGVSAAAADAERANAFLKYLRGPEALGVLRAKGLEPG